MKKLLMVLLVLFSNLSTSHAIFGGHEVEAGSPLATSVVSLFRSENLKCTGIIVREDAFLTAAHCMILLGERKITFGLRSEDPANPSRKVTSKRLHHGYNPFSDENAHDVAVGRFEGGLPRGFQPAKLILDFDQVKKIPNATLAGYGNSSGLDDDFGKGILRYLQIPFFNHTYSKTEVSFDQTHGQGACHGDSGGPGFVEIEGVPHVFAVASRGLRSNENECVGELLYTRIDPYVDWINETIASWDSRL